MYSISTPLNSTIQPHTQNMFYHSTGVINTTDSSNEDIWTSLLSSINAFKMRHNIQDLDPEELFHDGIKDELSQYINLHYSEQEAKIVFDKVTKVDSTNTWLHTASRYNYKDIVQFLINHSKKNNINIQNSMGETPLFEALRGEYIDLMMLLIKAGANLNIESNNGETPLELAMSLNKYLAMKTLIEQGANLNLQDKFGNTLLHKAIGDEDVLAVKILIHANADINIKNFLGYTPLECAINSDNIEIQQILNNASAEYLSSTAVSTISFETIKNNQSHLEDCIDSRVQEAKNHSWFPYIVFPPVLGLIGVCTAYLIRHWYNDSKKDLDEKSQCELNSCDNVDSALMGDSLHINELTNEIV